MTFFCARLEGKPKVLHGHKKNVGEENHKKGVPAQSARPTVVFWTPRRCEVTAV